MTFDGDKSHRGSLIYPVAYHPDAPMVPTALSHALANAYYQARWKNRVLITQSYGWNDLTPGLYSTTNRYGIADGAVTIRMLEGFARIPYNATRLEALLMVVALPTGDAQLSVRLSADDGTLYQGDAVTQDISPAQSSTVAPSLPPLIQVTTGAEQRRFAPGAESNGLYTLQCSVDHSVAGGDVAEIYATLALTGDAAGRFNIRPVHGVVWWEVGD